MSSPHWERPPARDRWIVGCVVVAVVLFAAGAVMLFGLR